MPRVPKKRNERYAKELDKMLRELGARPDPDDRIKMGYQLLDTRFGLLRLSTSANVAQEGATLFSRFEEPQRAAGQLSHVNPHSGKWNHHFFGTAQEFPAWKDGIRRELERLLAHRPNPRVTRSPESSAGFSIAIYAEHLIEDNARDRFSRRARHGDAEADAEARSHAIQAGYWNGEDEEITEKGWETLNEDVLKLERNALAWLRKNFASAHDEGHDGYGDLVGTVYFDKNNERQSELIELGEKDRIDMVDTSYGDLGDTAMNGVSDFGANVLGGQINFFDVV